MPGMDASQPPTNRFIGLDDAQVLDYAIAALRRAQAAAPGSYERLVQWGLYEQANVELRQRLYQYTLNKIHESREGLEP